MSSFTELRTRNNAGEEVSFEAFAGKVVLVVNVARL
jgi:glutathione peroxidase-family protein